MFRRFVVATMIGALALTTGCGLHNPFTSKAEPVTYASVAPVSYTHLDVYKRQRVVFNAPIKIEDIIGTRSVTPFQNGFGEINKTEYKNYKRAIALSGAKVCLLYTSRCV